MQLTGNRWILQPLMNSEDYFRLLKDFRQLQEGKDLSH